ncbi:MAG: hypothetical protein IAE83_00025 [Anaerolinea sp.]|nr:hypothetical protein [Anaerolinea sp.]
MTLHIIPSDKGDTPASHAEQQEIDSLLGRLQSEIQRIPSSVLGVSTAPVREAFQRYHDLMSLQYGTPISPAQEIPNPCPTNLVTGIQWLYDPVNKTCTYPSQAKNPSTAQQTDIVMSLSEAIAYTNNVGDVRSLFLVMASRLNHQGLTNMSDAALAVLVYSQVFAEEKWFKDYNWVHPYWNRGDDPTQPQFAPIWDALLGQESGNLNEKRYITHHFLAHADEWIARIREGEKSWRLSGFGFGLGNQPLNQALDAAQWYLTFMDNAPQRYGDPKESVLDDSDPNQRSALETLYEIMRHNDPWMPQPDPRSILMGELSDIEKSQFWNTMRFVWAGARHREGAYKDVRQEELKERVAIDYTQLLGRYTGQPDIPPSGRPTGEISAFALMTTVYTDSILVSEVTGYGEEGYIGQKSRSAESWSYFVNERNKAIRNVERMINAEGQYRLLRPLRVELKTQYDQPNGDFLPYSREEISKLVDALLFEANQAQEGISEQAVDILTRSDLLKQGYLHYFGKELRLEEQTIEGHKTYRLK